MRKFGDICKEKQAVAESLFENKVLNDFKLVYGAMLEHYGLTSIDQLDKEAELSFLTELKHYWSEEDGISEKGENFVKTRTMSLNENSTATQKKNYLKSKTYAIVNETLRQSDLKYRLYDVIDEMYHQIDASNVRDVLTPDMITNIISESFNKSLTEFTANINKELTESAKIKK